MRVTSVLFSFALAIVFSVFAFSVDANAQCREYKVVNESSCTVNVVIGIQDADGRQYTIGTIVLDPGESHRGCLHDTQRIYKFGLNGISVGVPAVGACISTGALCPLEICQDSPGAFVIN